MRFPLWRIGVWSWLLLLPGCATVPGGPAGFTVDEGSIARAAEYSRSTGEAGLIVEVRGRRLHESYQGDATAGNRHHVRSITKNLTALAVLAAAQDGLVDPGAAAAVYFEPWRGKPAYARITVRHLLDMTGGLDGAGSAIYRQPAKNIPAAAARARIVAAPGAVFHYGAASYEVLGALLDAELVRRGENYETYLQRRVLAPMGISMPGFRRDASGNPYHSAGASMTVPDLARLGRGILAQRQEFLPGSAANPAYRNSVWNNSGAAHADAITVHIEDLIGRPPGTVDWQRVAVSRNAPDDLLVLLGSRGQRVYCSPSMGLVVARTGESAAFRDAEFLARLFKRLPGS